MLRTVVVVACVTALVLTSGCSGLFPGDDRRPTPEPTRDRYDVPERTPTATPDRTAEPLASPAFRATVANHTAALRSAGQFTVRESVDRQFGGDVNATSPVTRTGTADLRADRYWYDVTFGTEGAAYESGELYQEGSTVYRRDSAANDSTVYRRTDPEALSSVPREWFRSAALDIANRSVEFPLERNGTGTVDGEEMARYTAADPGRFRGTYAEVRNVSTFRLTVLVDDRGIVRKFDLFLRGTLYTGDSYVERITLVITAVGDATVRPPDRLVGGNATTDGG